jgi:hypothetical protein
MCWACNTNGEEEECIQDIAGKARRKETTRKPRRRWANNVKMDLRDRIGWYGLD